MLPEVLPLAVDRLVERMGRLKSFCDHRITRLQSDAEFDDIVGILNFMVEARAEIVDLKGRPGAGEYVRKVFGDARIDVVTHLNAVQSAIEAVGTAIRGSAPVQSGAPIQDTAGNTGTGDFLLTVQWNADPAVRPVIVWRTFTPAQTATLRTLLGDVSTNVDLFIDSLTAALI